MCKTHTAVALTIVGLALTAAPAQATERLPQPGASMGGTVERTPRPGAPMQRMRTTAAQRVQLAFWRTVRKVIVCAAAIGAFVGGNSLLIWKLRKAGGVWKNAKRVLRARGRAAKVRLLTGIFGEVLGVDTIAEKC